MTGKMLSRRQPIYAQTVNHLTNDDRQSVVHLYAATSYLGTKDGESISVTIFQVKSRGH